METGQLRELKVKLGYFASVQWSPDGRELLTSGRDVKGRNQGLYRIDVQTGDVTLVGSGLGNAPQWAADGKHVFFRRGSAVFERNLSSGAEREVGQMPNAAGGPMALSPDGRSVVYRVDEPSGRQGLVVTPFAGGVPRPVLHVIAPERLSGFHWTADGASVAFAKQIGETDHKELWILDVAAGKARKLDINVDNWMIEDGFQFDDAGKQVAFVAAAGQPGLEIRALENFLPVAAVRPGAKK
jgi:Tol biopolymer transport system component